jgi:hypothetical protein
MAEDWTPGDDALCVVKDKWVDFTETDLVFADGPRPGQMLRVVDVGMWSLPQHPMVPQSMVGESYLMLHFAEYPNPKGYWARAFVKIRPLAEDNETQVPELIGEMA